MRRLNKSDAVAKRVRGVLSGVPSRNIVRTWEALMPRLIEAVSQDDFRLPEFEFADDEAMSRAA